MKFVEDCETCDRTIRITYDESVCTPEYCPFCGSEIDNDDGDYEPDEVPGLDEEEWN